ncbi:MAG: hypothetical protein FWH10_08065 [Oscillospiraceae bacterium]|nr:hypothetical protein [Oscillospiraceae bacterium]
MKSIKIITLPAFVFTSASIFVTPVYANAANIDAAAKTGDRGILSIIIAAAAFIMTAVITTKLTKRKNK